jgi:hypothetical protein
MSTWHNINNAEDVELNSDDNTIEVYIGEDYGGAIYVSIPLEYVMNVLPKYD